MGLYSSNNFRVKFNPFVTFLIHKKIELIPKYHFKTIKNLVAQSVKSFHPQRPSSKFDSLPHTPNVSFISKKKKKKIPTLSSNLKHISGFIQLFVKTQEFG